MPRKLTLKRAVLQELTVDELGGVVGGDNSFSCLDYVSCHVPWCIRTVRDCTDIIVTD